MVEKLSQDDRIQIIKEGLRHTEMHLAGLAQVADNADRRATTLTVTGIAFATLLMTFSEYSHALKSYIIFASLLSLIAAVWSIFATVPKKFHILGHRWKDWKGHLEDNDCLEFVLQSQADENDLRIDFNFHAVDRAARTFKHALILFVISLTITVAAEAHGVWRVYFEQQQASAVDIRQGQPPSPD